MLQLQRIHEERELVLAGLRKRNMENADALLGEVIALDNTRKVKQQKNDKALAEGNALSRQVGELLQSGKAAEGEALKVRIAELKKQTAALSAELDRISAELREKLYRLPNIPHEQTPPGKGAAQNVTVKTSSKSAEDVHGGLPHWEVAKQYDIIDFGLGVKVAGAGFPVYKGKGARLQRGLIHFFLDQAVAQGYLEIQPPVVINEDSGYGTGQLPDKEGQMYHIEREGLFLIPTAEVPITNLYRDMILTDRDLPIKNTGYTPCFRREAGSWGAHVRGLNRLHQFDKVEIVQICRPEDSYAALNEMCAHVESLLKALELPYRKLLLCAGDLGLNSALTYDMEVYAGGQRQWLEVSSISNFETFQANRLKLRMRETGGGLRLLHTLNGSALALPRIVAALLENNQDERGIRIPKALIPYTGFDRID